MKKMNTYGHADKTAGLMKRMSIMLCLIVLLAVDILGGKAVSVDAASKLKIRYCQKTRYYTGTRLSATLDGKGVNMHGTPGLALKNKKGTTIYMLPVADVFKDDCGISYSYKNQKITLKKYGITVKMTLNSKTAYVNGRKTQLEYPPRMIKFYNANKTKLYVPARFVATTFGYGYSYSKTSSTTAKVKLTTPFYIRYDDKWKLYNRTKANLTFDETKVPVSNMNCIVMDDAFYVQARAFAKSQIGGTYRYSPSKGTVTVSLGDKTLSMTIGSKTAQLNGKTVTLSRPVRLVLNGKTDVEFVMLPIASVAARLGLNYSYVSKTKTCALTRKDGTYFDWSAPESEVDILETVTDQGEEGVLEAPPSTLSSTGFYVMEAKGERFGKTDVVTVDGVFDKDNVAIWDSGSKIIVKILDCENKVGDESITIENPYLLKSATITQDKDGDTVLEIVKKRADINYEFSTEDGYVCITLNNGVQKNGYKIAVDVGHGAYTAGKRTPKLLESLDFDKDGVIDAKKGTQIREHTANVGVGNYAVAALERCGFEVYKSGFGSEDTPLKTRQANIKNSKSDYSISIHFNAYGSGFNSANGIEVFSHQNSSNAKNSYSLAKAIINTTSKGTSQKNRGVNREHTFAMCNASAMGTKGSILLECAFMTNWHEVKTMMASTDYWEETGEEIAKGFCNYLGVDYVEPY